MLKKILYILLILLVILFSIAVFIWMNLGSIWNAYYGYIGDKYYSEQQYEEALSYHNNMIEGDDREFALGNDYYRLGDYKNAAQAFSRIEGYKGLYNAGNAFFKFGDETSSIDDKIQFWERSLEFYEQSLQDKYTLEAQNNANLVRNKLEELQTSPQPSPTEEREQDSGQDNNEESSDSGQEAGQIQGGESGQSQESGDTSQTPIPQPRGEQYRLGEGSQVPEMTEGEKASIEKYIDDLQEEEIRNQRYFNKSGDRSSSQNVYDAFFNQFGSFDSSNSSGEKDW